MCPNDNVVENVSSVSNSPTLVENMETYKFISERTHPHIILKFLMNMWCVSHKIVTLKKEIPQC